LSDPTLWRAAQACIDAHGDDAEAELRRMVQRNLTAGDVAQAAVLFEIFQAVRHLRGVADIGRGTAH
jgi:hypothetical protein